jgi:hypothetical protein
MRRLLIVAVLGLAVLPAGADPAREQRARLLRDRARKEKALAWSIARRQGWQPKTDRYELMAIGGGRVWARQPCDNVAGITVAADLARTAPYNLSGSGITVGMWDQALVRVTHQELAPRATNREAGGTAQHATSVAGVLAALGFTPAAIGMAPQVVLECYEWNDDLAEVTARAMAVPGEAGALPLSNHSYDYLTGWTVNGFGQYVWYGIHGMREDTGFGIYDPTARDLDVIAYDAPYYLQVKPSGNDRGDSAPPAGTPFLYATTEFDMSYDPATDPLSDPWDQGGYDTIPHEQNAKNILVVGAVGSALSNGVRSVGAAEMTSFSGWGPTDDGRIKPDVVADGVSVLTTGDGGDSMYIFDGGTSIAAPGASGVAALLIESYSRLFPGAWMRSSTLKGLILHTADDLGRPGPDYTFGWGLIDAQAAAEQIRVHAQDRTRCDIREAVLTTDASENEFFYVPDGTNAIRATLCWTDPPGPPATNNTLLDDPTPRLVHDLDMVLVGPDGITNRPYVLDPAQPTNVATRGDNDLDNVEQIDVPSPLAVGLYRFVVSLEGAWATNRQDYSLLVTGLKRADEVARIAPDAGGQVVFWNAATGTVYDVLASDTLATPAWTQLETITAATDAASVVDTNPPSAMRFYHLRINQSLP